MKNKNIFSLRLYIEGLKQLRKMGIFMILLIAFMSLLTFYGDTSVIYTFFEINYMLILSYMLAAPVLTLTLFSSLNKRNSCDFYYSTPYSRTCIYISYVLSVITWVVGILVAISLPSMLSAICFRNATIIYTEIVIEFLGLIAASLLVISAIALAMSLTGKLYANILLSGIILFMPRIITNILITFTINQFPYLDVEGFWGLLNNRYNIVTYSIGAISYSNFNFIHTDGVIYTFVLAVIYFILAGVCYSRRNSDIAKTTGSKPVSLIITGALPTFICIATSQLEHIILYYIIGIIIFFIFELTISRNFVKSLKKMPLFLISILISLVFDSCIDIIGNVTNATELDTDEIDYITLTPQIRDNYFALWYGYDMDEYYDLVSYEIKIDDEYILDAVSKSLSALDNIDYEIKYEYYSTPIAIHSGNNVYYRNLYYSPYANKIHQAVEDSEEFHKQITTLPDYSDSYIESHSYYFDEIFRQTEIEQIYNNYVKELNLNDMDVKKDLLYEHTLGSDSSHEISIYFKYKGHLSKIPYANITPEHTPNTYRIYEELLK